jgi:hypothetical protein
MSDQTPPRENLIRAVMPGVEFRDASEGDPLPDGVIGILRVLFSPVGEWTEINSAWEGNFLERFAEGAWKKTIRESGAKVRSLFQHGMDPQIGDKPLGPIRCSRRALTAATARSSCSTRPTTGISSRA